jgi:hypothetical protein
VSARFSVKQVLPESRPSRPSAATGCRLLDELQKMGPCLTFGVLRFNVKLRLAVRLG